MKRKLAVVVAMLVTALLCGAQQSTTPQWLVIGAGAYASMPGGCATGDVYICYGAGCTAQGLIHYCINGVWYAADSSGGDAVGGRAALTATSVVPRVSASGILGPSKFSCTGSPVTCLVYDDTAKTGATTLAVRAGPGQSTTDLVQWRDSAGAALTAINSTGSFTGNAATATALAADPTDCTDQFARGINASGTAQCASVAGSDFADQAENTIFGGPVAAPAAAPSFRALVDADVPDTITLTSITQITDRSHTALSDIGTNTHADVDTHIAAGTAHGSTDANTASAIVQRDASGNFAAGTITANTGIAVGSGYGIFTAPGGANATGFNFTSATSITAYVANALKLTVTTNGVQWADGAEPACAAGERFHVVAVAGGAGVADTFRVCSKDAADAYAWRALF